MEHRANLDGGLRELGLVITMRVLATEPRRTRARGMAHHLTDASSWGLRWLTSEVGGGRSSSPFAIPRRSFLPLARSAT